MKNILVAIDFDGNEQLLLDNAVKFAKAFDANVWIIHIAAPDSELVGFGLGSEYAKDSRITTLKKEHKLLQDYAHKLRQRGVFAEGVLLQGATINMIMDEVSSLEIDIIITGHYEHSFFYKAVVGSVAEEIIKQSRIPILLVPLVSKNK